MAEATLIVVPPSQVAREVEISEGIISIGRALDNTISVEGDTSISRYHAEIEVRGDEFWVYDLGSSNGTTVNDEPVTEDRKLQPGDMISVGGETYIEFHLGRKKTFKEEDEEEEKSSGSASSGVGGGGGSLPLTSTTASTTATAAPSSSSGTTALLVGAGVLGGLAIVAVAGVLLYTVFGPTCPGDVTIANPRSGTVLTGPTKFQVEFKEGDQKCIDRVIYQIDGKPVPELEKEAAPYEAEFDPTAFPDFADGNTHTLTIVVEDRDGNKTVQKQTIYFSYNPSGTPPPDATPSPGGSTQTGNGGTTSPTPPPQVRGDVKSMSEALAAKIGERTGYIFTPEFVSLINSSTNEYRVPGSAGNKARMFKFEINKAFRDRGVNALVGYIMAFSRSKFDPNKKGAQGELGLWQIAPSVVRGLNHLTANEAETVLSEPKRGSEVAAAYINDLIARFGNDGFMYAIACFGMTLEQVGQFRLQLENADPGRTLRLDFMQMVKRGIVTPEMRDRVVKFMAAGIVGENPQAFGLPDPPFSSLL
jgi:pSer/pThr/pTyr-binding forkhead associated (FHA) protein